MFEGLGETEDAPPPAVGLDEIRRQFALDQDEALHLCRLNRIDDAAEIMLGFLQWATSDAVHGGTSQST